MSSRPMSPLLGFMTVVLLQVIKQQTQAKSGLFKGLDDVTRFNRDPSDFDVHRSASSIYKLIGDLARQSFLPAHDDP